ncbi:MAG TPA: response regulator [Dehalococcoidia bacterium]|nr:response regulator [Dehalococcoidia bacterium]
MDADTIKAVATLAWPVLAATLALALLPTIKGIARSRPFKIKVGEFELSVEEASNQLRKQIDDLQDQVQVLRRAGAEPAPAAPSTLAEPTLFEPKGRILWVDDRPDNNAYEIAKLEKDGYEIQKVTSTQAALDVLRSRSEKPTAIISDMSRREGLLPRHTAGLELIREVRALKLDMPIYIYASGEALKYRQRVREAGGNGITASPIELFHMIETDAARER